MKPDMGMRVAAMAKQVTPDQVAEMFAIRLSMFHPDTRCPIMAKHGKSDTHAPLIAAKLITWKPHPGWARSTWRMATLTEFGERVLLSIAEDAMVAMGVMRSLDPPEWNEDWEDVA